MSARPASDAPSTDDRPRDFIRAIIDDDLRAGRHDTVVTRFPPEPNGYLHMGHAKSIVLNFGLAEQYGGRCHLRFDDTNPETEDEHYVESIKDTVRWLGFDWGPHLYHAADYFERMYAYAEALIESGKAYVDSQSTDEIRAGRGTVTEPGTPSPYRGRSVEENLDLFRRMRAGEFEDGAHVLRARGDMASPNMKMRDPLLYRIRHAAHYRSGDDWCIYPMYDWAHPLEDAIEGITHSLCTLEFDNNRELYDWVLDNTVGSPRPHQYEFARGNLDYTVMSKRKLLQLVEDGHVAGWDDPRLPTLAGLRRRGVRPEAIRAFWEGMGITKVDASADPSQLDHVIRDDLNHLAPRVMAVLRPLKVVITNYPEGQTEELEAPYWPHDVPNEGSRAVPFSRELYIERDDFMEDPPRKFFRLAPGREVRLRYGYFITCDEVVRNDAGEVVELRCTYDPATRGGDAPDGRSPKGTLHWVSAAHAVPAAFRLYDRLFTVSAPDAQDAPFTDFLNPHSLVTLQGFAEPSVKADDPATRYQFERQGYFWRDPVDGRGERLVFNRIVALRDTWAKQAQPKPAPEPTPKREAKPTPAPAPPKPAPDPVEALDDAARARFLTYTHDHGLQLDDALLLAGEPALGAFFEAAVAAHPNAQGVANWIVNEVVRETKATPVEQLPFTPQHLAELVALIDDDTISTRIAKDVYTAMLETGEAPRAIVKARGLEQVSDRAELAGIVDELIGANPDKVAAYRGGKTGLMGFFVGGVMRATGGKANPQLVQALLQDRLADA